MFPVVWGVSFCAHEINLVLDSETEMCWSQMFPAFMHSRDYSLATLGDLVFHSQQIKWQRAKLKFLLKKETGCCYILY